MSNFDPFDIHGQEHARAEADERAALAVQVELDDLKWLMGDKRGRRFIARSLEHAGVWRTSFSTDALVMAFNEGARNAGLRLLARITESLPKQYAVMLKEHGK